MLFYSDFRSTTPLTILLQFVPSLEQANNEDVGSEDITRVFWDGPTYDDKPRFLKVCCNNRKSKTAFIKYINKNRRNLINNLLRASPDLSYLQRKRSRELQAELQGRLTKAYVPLSADCKSRKPPKELNTLLMKKHNLWNKPKNENVGDIKQKYNQCLRNIKQYTYSQKHNTERKILDNKT
uniref:Uncharacterized protein n=1 Tax=Romanomermis culicivorax TaxID=13658 RepID=A0A915JSB8_ROMCU